MKTMKFFLLLLTFSWSAVFHAAPSFDLHEMEDPFRDEIKKMLSRSSLIIEEDITVLVTFTMSGDKKIEIKSISSAHPGVKSFLEVRLNGQSLHGNIGTPGKLYELPVRIKAIR